ncbi:Cystatin-12 [Myotis davidii]|uniref:Cystatin-12 n=1 Tax=Myotis davidii TaxID=225400 RepID=L5M9T1_MYODS|nr:Cystatin-12 [Myotis davidii]
MLLKVPLLLGLIALGPPVCSAKFVDESKNTPLFAIGVEFAVFQFNQAQEDEHAYKLLWVGRSQRKVNCTFIVDARPWISQFTLLDSTCLQT